MAISSPEIPSNNSQKLPVRPDINQELFSEYKERYLNKKEWVKKETHSWLSDLTSKIVDSFSTPRLPEKIQEPKYDQLKMSLIAQEYLNKNHSEIKKENPDKSCIIIYLPGKEKSQAKKLCIPRSNHESKTLYVSGFSLTPVPKSNGYNTEYIIKDNKGNDWTQLAILFPAENPKYNKKHIFENNLRTSEADLKRLNASLGKVPKTKKALEIRKQLQTKIEEQKWKIADFKAKIATLGNQEQYTHFSYIPYREWLNTSENQKLWFEYLSETMKKTYEHQVGNTSLWKIHSKIPQLSIAEALPWQYPFILNLIERMDFEVYFDSTGKNIKSKDILDPIMNAQLEKSLTTFGANTSNAFNWQKSKVWAQWVGQIMLPTYYLFWKDKKYGDLFPEADFDTASRDHETSFRLQVSHFDDQLFQFPDTIKKNWKSLIKSPRTDIGTGPRTDIGIIALLAAGYNGSMTRIMEEVFGKDYKKSSFNKDEYKKNEYERKLSIANILKSMKETKEASIKKIQWSNKPRKIFNKKTKKYTELPPAPLTIDQNEKIARITARYRESMTYVLKSEYVWWYLKKNYRNQF